MKNKLTDLNDHLFEQLERLNDDALTPEQIAKEVTRTEAMVKVSEQIISNANIVLRGAERSWSRSIVAKAHSSTCCR